MGFVNLLLKHEIGNIEQRVFRHKVREQLFWQKHVLESAHTRTVKEAKRAVNLDRLQQLKEDINHIEEHIRRNKHSIASLGFQEGKC